MKNKILCLILIVMLSMPSSVYSQRSISGPACVTTGIIYQYDLKPKWDGASEMTLCIRGGTIEKSSSDCMKTVSLPYIRVTWNEDVDNGSIYFSYDGKKDSITVSITKTLFAGLVEADKKVQRLTNGTTPQQINCSLPTGGNCSPDYRYQWQSSVDGENWEDIASAKDQNMSFKSAPDKTTFYRRKITENKSGTVAYSEVSVIAIQPADMRAWNQ